MKVLLGHFDWNPILELPEAIALAVAFAGLGIWLAWRGSINAQPVSRRRLIFLRTLGLALLAMVWLNPGHWRTAEQHAKRDWLILLDRSASMKAEQSENTSRWQTGVSVAEALIKTSGEQGAVRVYPFSTELEEEATKLTALVPDGSGTHLGRALSAALEQRNLAGIVLLTDGRSTQSSKWEELALRARGRELPIHAVPLGTSSGLRDLVLHAMPRLVTAYQGQPAKFVAQLENQGLGPIKPTVILFGPDGQEVARKEALLAEGARQSLSFEIAHPTSAGNYTLQVAPWPGEHFLVNNRDVIHLSVLSSKTRVLLLEGAPYWDSKFLAQMIRQQTAMEVLTIHRLNEERYFRVEAAGAEPIQSPDSLFPANAKELGRYDLIVFGKGAEGFLTPERMTALQGFVRDQGGTVLFARGKPYAGHLAGLESLEPVEWGESDSTRVRFSPLPDSVAQLFGAALPAAEDPLWASLPMLDDVRSITRLKPFTRVLAEGVAEGRKTTVPLLISRRFGRGTVVTLNADGLWRWDFRSEPHAQGSVYAEFWMQLIQWCATYSEFRPGQDYAVRLDQSEVQPGSSVRAIISYRGATELATKPYLQITRDGQRVGDAAATVYTDEFGTKQWTAIVNPDLPGRYEVRVADVNNPELLQGEANLHALAPLTEAEDLRPNLQALTLLAHDSGGEIFSPDNLDKLIAGLWKADPVASAKTKSQWESAWPRWWLALILAGCLGGEWWLRRREGLI